MIGYLCLKEYAYTGKMLSVEITHGTQIIGREQSKVSFVINIIHRMASKSAQGSFWRKVFTNL